MANRVKTGASSRNWLKELDEEVAQSGEPNEWQRYSLFYFVRYDKWIHLNIAEEVARWQLLSWRARLVDYPQIIERLPEKQLDQLAGLMYDTISRLESFYGPPSVHDGGTLPLHLRTGLKWKSMWTHSVASEAKRRNKMLTRRLEKAQRALEELRDYAEDWDHYRRRAIWETQVVSDSTKVAHQSSRASHNRQSAKDPKQFLDPLHGGIHYVVAAQKCLNTLEKIKSQTQSANEAEQSAKALSAEYPRLNAPTDLCMMQLFWFFRHGCGIPAKHAEVRVALIRNAFWDRFGISPVTSRTAYDGIESAGCSAVAEAVRRFH